MATRSESPARVEIQTPSGVRAELARDDEGAARVQVRAPDGRVLVEVDDDGSVTLVAVTGDLRLRAPEGRVVLEGGEGVRVAGKVVEVEASHLRQLVGLWETRAKRIVEKTQDVYRDAEGISQTRAGQVKIVAQKTVRMIAQRLRFRAKKDAKLQGEKIYLG